MWTEGKLEKCAYIQTASMDSIELGWNAHVMYTDMYQSA